MCLSPSYATKIPLPSPRISLVRAALVICIPARFLCRKHQEHTAKRSRRIIIIIIITAQCCVYTSNSHSAIARVGGPSAADLLGTSARSIGRVYICLERLPAKEVVRLYIKSLHLSAKSGEFSEPHGPDAQQRRWRTVDQGDTYSKNTRRALRVKAGVWNLR
jgi:hypothetical protein